MAANINKGINISILKFSGLAAERAPTAKSSESPGRKGVTTRPVCKI